MVQQHDNTRSTSGATISAGRGLLALSPIAVFLILYLSVSIVNRDFYKMPLSIAFIVAAMWALLLIRDKKPTSARIEVFSRGAANPNILYMIWIFIMAGAFSALASSIGAVDATVELTLSVLPRYLVLPGLFLTACFISMSIGTSVGTIVALTPFAVEVAPLLGMDTAFVTSIVLGGSFFGDNLSFISDTTIAATRTQHVAMSDKFRMNLRIALPAAIVVLAVYTVLGINSPEVTALSTAGSSNPWPLIIPYLLVIATATAGLNVMLVLTLGIIATAVLASVYGTDGFIDMSATMAGGIKDMSDLIIVTLLAAGLLEVIKHNGGINWLIQVLTRRINGTRGARATIASLVGVVNLCTANNTIAIITIGDIAHDISRRFKLDPRRTASILDTTSCIVQCVIPYGAQTLLAAGLAHVSPVAFLSYHYYAAALAVMVVVAILMKTPAGITPETETLQPA